VHVAAKEKPRAAIGTVTFAILRILEESWSISGTRAQTALIRTTRAESITPKPRINARITPNKPPISMCSGQFIQVIAQRENKNLAVAAKVYIQLIINKATYAVRV